MKLLRVIGAALLAAWLFGCASTVNSSAGDAAPVDARPDTFDTQADARPDAPDAPADVPGDALDAAFVRRGTVAVGGLHVCALDARGAVWCWGNNDYGQLGDGTTERRPTPVRVADIEGAVQVAADQTATCVVLRDRTVRCWGKTMNRSVEPRMPIDRDALTLQPQAVANLDRVQSVAVRAGPSESVACALRDDASVWCWGSASLVPGYPRGTRIAAPTGPSSLTGVAMISLESTYNCSVARVGTVTCWGIRNWDPSFRREPTVLDGVVDARSVTLGGNHLCVLSRVGTVRCIGTNTNGELGDGTTLSSPSAFVAVRGLLDAVAISNNGSATTVALRADGTVVRWGYPNPQLRPFAPVSELRDIVDVSGGLGNFCARRVDGALFCWGTNSEGQIGNGTQRTSHIPVRVAGLGP